MFSGTAHAQHSYSAYLSSQLNFFLILLLVIFVVKLIFLGLYILFKF